MNTIEEYISFLEDKSKPLDDRMKELITKTQRFSFSDRAYLGQVLLEVITPEEEESLKGKVVNLRAKVKAWKSGVPSPN